MAKQELSQVTIHRPNFRTIELGIKGTSSLICHRWDKKVIKLILDKQMGKNVKAKAKKDPQADYEGSLYRLSDGSGYGFPAVAFKSACVSAARLIDGLQMVQVRQMLHVHADDGDLVRIEGEPSMREDMVRLNGKTADVRHRGEFKDWGAKIRIQYNADIISADHVTNLLYLAGLTVGIGEWRIERGGIHGMFTVDDLDAQDSLSEAA